MFRVTGYPMISKTESGRVGYRQKYRVAGRVQVPAGHCTRCAELSLVAIVNKLLESWMLLDRVVVVGLSSDLAVDIKVQGVPKYLWWQS